MTPPLSHYECRQKVCGVCLRKAKEIRPITEECLILIKNFHYDGYSLDDNFFPLVVCKSCSLALKAYEKNPSKPGRKLPNTNYEKLSRPGEGVITRSVVNCTCMCSICFVGKLRAGQHLHYEKTQKPDLGRPRESEVELAFPLPRCSLCLTEVGKGKPHNCSRSSMQEN